MVEQAAHQIVQVATTAYQDQKAGTSGLRKKTKVFSEQENYLENFVASIFIAQPPRSRKLVASGDGRYWNDVAIQKIIKLAAGYGVSEVIVGQNGLLSTPAVSNLIIQLNKQQADSCMGAILLTASHNPGGPNEDFGIKFNTPEGGPAPETITDAVFAESKQITAFPSVPSLPDVDLSVIGETQYQVADTSIKVSVVDSTEAYVALMKELFNFDQIRTLVQRNDFNVRFDGMHGAAGPYARKIFVDDLGVDPGLLMRCDVLPDFGGGHPDPNLTYAADLVASMGVFEARDDAADFAAACDGDADRNMVLGKNFFVTPSDSVAIIVAHHQRIPYLSGGIPGAARSMPTSQALDKVCEKLNIGSHMTPTGWKYFGSLLGAGDIAICGEESFGTGSHHVREKDGLWAVLAWLQILANLNEQGANEAAKPIVSVEQIVREHWAEYGRNYYQRYDYEGLTNEQGAAVKANLQAALEQWPSTPGRSCQSYTYTDPHTQEVAQNQGMMFFYPDGSRFVFRESGTGSSGVTIRLYLEKYSSDELSMDAADALSDIVADALRVSDMQAATGRDAPTVIT